MINSLIQLNDDLLILFIYLFIIKDECQNVFYYHLNH